MENYKVVLFKNKKAKKILKKFVTLKKAKEFYNKELKKSEETLFPVEIEMDKPCRYEIAIIENSESQLFPIYLTDEMGRNVKVKLENSGMTIFEISNYKKEEQVFDLSQNKKINVDTLIKKYLRGDGIKMISGLNNKIIIQNDDKFNLFSLKNVEEVKRILDFFTSHFIKINKRDCLIIKDVSTPQRKYLLELLSKNGYDKKMLYRKKTTYSHLS